MKKTAQTAQPTTVRIVMQSSELHRMAPSSTKFASKEEINTPGDGVQLYGRTKLGLIYLARQLIKRHLADLPQDRPILVMSVHPGTVDTDLQSQWTESYGIIGKALDVLSSKVGKSAEEGAEPSLWAAVSTDVFEGNWKDHQVRAGCIRRGGGADESEGQLLHRAIRQARPGEQDGARRSDCKQLLGAVCQAHAGDHGRGPEMSQVSVKARQLNGVHILCEYPYIVQ